MIFMLAAGASTTVFEYPHWPVSQAVGSDLVRRAAIGTVMTAVTAAIVYSTWGQTTGAHINPAVTWSFYRLGRISLWNAVFYTVFQFLGAIVATPVLLLAIGEPFTHKKVNYGATQPGPLGSGVAFAAEFAMSFALMLVLLTILQARRFEKLTGLATALLIGLYITFESPLSGMSLNPARSFGAALTSGQWTGIWVYFVAPILAMELAAELHRYHNTADPQALDRLPHYPVLTKD